MLLRRSAGFQQVLAGSHLVSCEVQTYGLLVVLQVLAGAHVVSLEVQTYGLLVVLRLPVGVLQAFAGVHVVSLEVQTYGLLVVRTARLRREVVGAWSLWVSLAA